MFNQATNSPILNRMSGAGLGRLALVLGAAWALSAAASAPASAQANGWREACSFRSSPQNYGDAIRERVCIVENHCQAMADAQGRMYTGPGCVMVPPMAGGAPQAEPRSVYTKR